MLYIIDVAYKQSKLHNEVRQDDEKLTNVENDALCSTYLTCAGAGNQWMEPPFRLKRGRCNDKGYRHAGRYLACLNVEDASETLDLKGCMFV